MSRKSPVLTRSSYTVIDALPLLLRMTTVQGGKWAPERSANPACSNEGRLIRACFVIPNGNPKALKKVWREAMKKGETAA